MASVEDRLRELVAEHLGVDRARITRQSHFENDLGADSLDMVELVMEIEEEFDIDIPDEVAEGIHTFGEAVDQIEKSTAGSQASAS